MKKTYKRVLALILSVFVFSGAFNIFFVTAAVSDSGTCGTEGYDVKWSVDTDTGVLTISGSGEMLDYSVDFAAPWNVYCGSIRSVKIGSGVTNVGDYAFNELTSLVSVTIPNSVTRIGADSFCNCKNLTGVTMGSGVAIIGDYAFCDCKSLAYVALPDSVASVGYLAFSGTAYYNNTTNWTGGALYNNRSLLSVKPSVTGSFTVKTGTVCVAGGAFMGCNGITGVTVPDGVKSIGSLAFSGCSGLKSITIPDSVTSIGASAFAGTEYYKTDKNWTSGVLYIGHHLIGAKATISGAYTVAAGTKCIADSAFFDCKKLKSVTVPDSVVSVGDHAFENCTGLTGAVIGSGASVIGAGAFAECVSLTDVTAGSSVKSIGRGAFYDCLNLVGIKLGKNLTAVGAFAFCGCAKLADVYFAGTQTQWGKISISHSNDELTSAKIHYNWNGGTQPHDHSYTSKVTKQPTCTEPGVRTCTCSCGDVYTEIIPASGHSFTKYVYNNDATTERDGTKTAKCDHCDATNTIVAEGTMLAADQAVVAIRNYTADKTVDYKTTITFSADVKNPVSGAAVHWFIDGQDKGAGDTYTVSKAKKSFTVQVKYIKDGKALAESKVEKVNVKTGFFAKLAAFFRSIFGALPKVVQGYMGAEILDKML